MSKVKTFHVAASAALIFLVTSMPLQAEALGGLGSAVGGTLGAVGNTVGNTVGAVGNTVNGVTDGSTTTRLGALNRRGVLSADAKSDIINGVMAKARVLSPEELARLCLGTGGGNQGCGSGNRPRILGIIDARLEVLSNKRLVSVCVTVGAGCGGTSIARVGSAPIVEIGDVPGLNVPDVPDSTSPTAASRVVADLSDREVVAYKKRCVSVLKSPQKYEHDIVSICRLIKRQRA